METKNVKTLKNELKELAEKIRVAKQERKTVRFNGERTLKSTSSWYSDAEYAAGVVAVKGRGRCPHPRG